MVGGVLCADCGRLTVQGRNLVGGARPFRLCLRTRRSGVGRTKCHMEAAKGLCRARAAGAEMCLRLNALCFSKVRQCGVAEWLEVSSALMVTQAQVNALAADYALASPALANAGALAYEVIPQKILSCKGWQAQRRAYYIRLTLTATLKQMQLVYENASLTCKAGGSS